MHSSREPRPITSRKRHRPIFQTLSASRKQRSTSLIHTISYIKSAKSKETSYSFGLIIITQGYSCTVNLEISIKLQVGLLKTSSKQSRRPILEAQDPE